MKESELLFSEILNCNRADLFLNRGVVLDRPKSELLAAALKRRIRGEPLQYILGKQEFFGLEFKVDKNVFIPRPETEILVETAIKYAYRLSHGAYRILELGTGSGCIAISLAKYLSNFHITATDISQEALEVAKENSRHNNVESKITFLKSNLFESLPLCALRSALCVSNPPYITTAGIERLQPEIGYEPRIALDGKEDGLDFYRRIILSAPDYLREGGFLVLEMGFGQSRSIQNIFKESKKFELIEIVKDYNDIDRIVVGKRYG